MRKPALVCACLLMLLVADRLTGTETENLGIAALPVPGKVAIDGKFDDWDLSGGIFSCGNIEQMRDKFAIWTHVMYDAQNLYVLARWIDETPLNNPGQITGSYGFQGDCLQVRIIGEPGTPNERCSHWTCWQGVDGRHVMDIAYGRDFKEGNVKDAQGQGARQAFLKNSDGKGYTQEIAIPWKLLFKGDRTPKAGDAIAMTLEPNFSVGQSGRLTLKDIFKPGVAPDRVFTFMGSGCWGAATLERQGKVQPRSLRLADAREFKVRLEKGLPVVDWSGLVKAEELRGFKPIRFTMPEEGYISLQILNSDGQVVRQLLNQSFQTKGDHEVVWDGLTTPYYLTPGKPVPPGGYSWRAIWHKGISVRLRGWACNSGNAPWDSGPGSNWGGDHGVPCAAAAAGDKVFLGWSGAEAGSALLGCDLAGDVQWKNSRQGMAGAEYVAADGDLVYAVNWGAENSNYLYRLNAAKGVYVEYPDNSPDVYLNQLLPKPEEWPNRLDGLAVRDGKLFLTINSARFTRKHVTNWRNVLEKAKGGKDGNLGLWARLDEGAQKRAAEWLAGNQSEDEALKSPNYYTPDVRDAAIEQLNRLLQDKTLTSDGGKLSDTSLALVNRRHVERVFSDNMLKLKTGVIAVVDAKQRKLLSLHEVPSPGMLYAVSEKLVYVVSGGNSVVALDATSGKHRTVIRDLKNATGVAADKEGLIYVGVREPDNQVKVFSAEGKLLRAIGRQGGRPLTGRWQQDGMAFVQGIAVDSEGKLWVTEADMSPKRISVWDCKTGKFVKEFFGPTSYGALGGAINPSDPNLMVGHGCEWRIDPATGRETCLGCFTRKGMSNARFAVGPNGKLYLAIAPGWAFEASPVLIFERLGDVDFKLRASFTYEGKDDTRRTLFWADENGDGQEQSGEVTKIDGHLRFSGWYMNYTPDMAIYARWEKPKSNGETFLQLKPVGFTACGAPKYDPARAVKMPAGSGLGSYDGRFLVGQAGGEAERYEGYEIASGKKLWEYPNPFSGVHGSHRAPPPKTGLFRGSFGPCGVAKLPPPVGNVWIFATNVGEWHVLTEQGFYLTRLFEGDPMKVVWPEKAVPGVVLDTCPPGLGGEDFGGSCCMAKDGKLYLQAGKTGFWNCEVVGVETVKAMSGSPLSISADDVVKAEKIRDEQLQAAVGTRQMVVHKKTVEISGNVDKDFSGIESAQFKKQDDAQVRFVAARDDQNLYLAWDVRDRTPWINKATVPEQMYMSGDTVDFQLGTDSKADRKREEAVRGDLRLSIGNFQGQPTAVLYRRVSDVKKPKQFSSGVIKSYAMDYVAVVPEARIKVNVRPNDGYLVEVAVPWSVLGGKPQDGQVLPGDTGVTHGGPDGGRTRLRSYWNNQQTGIVDDVVFELKMEPRNWGTLEFK